MQIGASHRAGLAGVLELQQTMQATAKGNENCDLPAQISTDGTTFVLKSDFKAVIKELLLKGVQASAIQQTTPQAATVGKGAA